MADDLIVSWNGTKERAGDVPGLSTYTGPSQLAICTVKGHGAILKRGDQQGLRTGTPPPKPEPRPRPVKAPNRRRSPVLLNQWNQHSQFCRCYGCEITRRMEA